MTQDNNAMKVLLDDAVLRLGKARLALDLARDLMQQSTAQVDTAGDKIAAAAAEIRALVLQ